ncbi:MAG: hypothetical protein PWQ76_1145, partial [Clostridiales bacterium]|nr:hypothetical protein [Clostridiales bacterium]
MKAFGTVHKYG